MTCPRSENGSRRCYWLAMGTGGALVLGIALAGTAGLRVNATASMPHGIWHVEALGARIGRGEIVSVCLPQSPALNEAVERGYISDGACPGGHEPLMKPVAAVAGDRVTVTALGIAVNGEQIAQSAPLDERRPPLAAGPGGRLQRPDRRGMAAVGTRSAEFRVSPPKRLGKIKVRRSQGIWMRSHAPDRTGRSSACGSCFFSQSVHFP